MRFVMRIGDLLNFILSVLGTSLDNHHSTLATRLV